MDLDREQLVSYLLGEMPEEGKVALEQRYFVSDDLFTELLVAEDELAYDYAANRLSRERRRRFDATIGATERGRKNVELARALLDALRKSHSHRVMGYWGIGIAASILLAIAGVWTGLRLASLTREVEQLRAVAAAKPPAANPVEAAFFLTPGISRGDGGTSRLAVRPEADVLRLDLLAPPGTAAAEYLVEFRSNEVVVWSQSLPLSGRTWTARPAARLFAPGDYEVSVRRVTAGEQGPELANYSFRLVRP